MFLLKSYYKIYEKYLLDIMGEIDAQAGYVYEYKHIVFEFLSAYKKDGSNFKKVIFHDKNFEKIDFILVFNNINKIYQVKGGRVKKEEFIKILKQFIKIHKNNVYSNPKFYFIIKQIDNQPIWFVEFKNHLESRGGGSIGRLLRNIDKRVRGEIKEVSKIFQFLTIIVKSEESAKRESKGLFMELKGLISINNNISDLEEMYEELSQLKLKHILKKDAPSSYTVDDFKELCKRRNNPVDKINATYEMMSRFSASQGVKNEGN